MKTFGNNLVVGILISFLSISCSSDDPEPFALTGPAFSISEMAGSWEAVEAAFIPAVAHEPEDQVAFIQEGGSVSMVIQTNGRFTINGVPVVGNQYSYKGRMFFEDGESFAIEFDKYSGDYDYWFVRLTATTLELNAGDTAGEYDFDNDGTFEAATVILKFKRTITGATQP